MLLKALTYLLLFSLFACSAQQNSKLEGHWHRYDGGEHYSLLSTLDVLDSITITNRYVLHGDRLIFPRINNNGVPILPYNTFEESTKFLIEGDTLFIWNGSSGPEIFVRSHLENCKLKDPYGYTRLDIDLKKGNTDTELDISYQNFCTQDIYVGHPRKGYYDELRLLYSDSVFVQVNDVFITFDMLWKVWQNMSYECGDRKRNINLHVDSSISAESLDKIQKLIPESVSIHTAIAIDQNNIGLAKIRN